MFFADVVPESTLVFYYEATGLRTIFFYVLAIAISTVVVLVVSRSIRRRRQR